MSEELRGMWWEMWRRLFDFSKADKNHPYLDILSTLLIPCHEDYPWHVLDPHLNDNEVQS